MKLYCAKDNGEIVGFFISSEHVPQRQGVSAKIIQIPERNDMKTIKCVYSVEGVFTEVFRKWNGMKKDAYQRSELFGPFFSDAVECAVKELFECICRKNTVTYVPVPDEYERVFKFIDIKQFELNKDYTDVAPQSIDYKSNPIIIYLLGKFIKKANLGKFIVP